MRAPNDPDYGHHDSRTPPTARLVMAILSQAVQDLFGSPHGASTKNQASLARHESLQFLTATSGQSAHWRRRYCSLVDLDPEILRARIIAILESDAPPSLAYGVGQHPEGLAEARTMWAALRPRPTTGTPVNLPRIVAPKPGPLVPIKPRTEHQYEAVRHLIYGLLKTPHSDKDLVIATNGDVGEHQIRRALKEGLEQRLLSRDTKGRHLLRKSAALPHTCVLSAIPNA
jgi:hypothetical protein